MQIKKILVPVDGSHHSLKALEAAKDMSEIFNSEIILLHVVDPIQLGESPRGLLDCNTPEHAKSEKARILNEADDSVGNIASEKLCIVGNPAEEIIKKLEEDDIDLLVIAKKGASGIERYIIGSVSSKVIEHSSKPVFVIE